MYKQSLFVMYKFTLLFTGLRLFVTYKFIIYIQVKLCCMYKQINYVVQNPSLNHGMIARARFVVRVHSLPCLCNWILACAARGCPHSLTSYFFPPYQFFYSLTILFIPTHASEKGRAFFGLQIRSQPNLNLTWTRSCPHISRR